MPDMLVKLYELPALAPALEAPHAAGIEIRRAFGLEKRPIAEWIGEHFNAGWASECESTLYRMPPTCFVAVQGGELAGFACYDATRKGFFGPTGVLELMRGKGIGAALLLACLHDMFAQGYGYAIIGWAGPTEFYSKICGAVTIPDSEPGVYRGVLDVF